MKVLSGSFVSPRHFQSMPSQKYSFKGGAKDNKTNDDLMPKSEGDYPAKLVGDYMYALALNNMNYDINNVNRINRIKDDFKTTYNRDIGTTARQLIENEEEILKENLDPIGEEALRIGIVDDISKLTGAVRRCLGMETNETYIRLFAEGESFNPFLSEKGRDGLESEGLRQIYDIMMYDFKNLKPLEEDITLYRAEVYAPEVHPKRIEMFKNLKKGDIYKANRFNHVSKSDYAHTKYGKEYSTADKILLTIKVPKGAKISQKGVGYFGGECVMPADAQYRVLKSNITKDYEGYKKGIAKGYDLDRVTDVVEIELEYILPEWCKEE